MKRTRNTDGGSSPNRRGLMRHRYLSHEEERAALERAVAGDAQAIDLLVRTNAQFVTSQITRFLDYGVDHDDLFQEGVLGLMHAIRKFDIKRQLRFRTYAAWWVRAYAGRYARQTCSDIREPEHAIRKRARKARGESLPPGWSEELDRSAEIVASLDDAIGTSGSMRLRDVIRDDGRPFDELEARSSVERLLCEDCLDERDRFVLERRYLEDATFEEVAAELFVTRQRVEQIEVAALASLRDRTAARLAGVPLQPKRRPAALPARQLPLPLFGAA